MCVCWHSLIDKASTIIHLYLIAEKLFVWVEWVCHLFVSINLHCHYWQSHAPDIVMSLWYSTLSWYCDVNVVFHTWLILLLSMWYFTCSRYCDVNVVVHTWLILLIFLHTWYVPHCFLFQWLMWFFGMVTQKGNKCRFINMNSQCTPVVIKSGFKVSVQFYTLITLDIHTW